MKNKLPPVKEVKATEKTFVKRYKYRFYPTAGQKELLVKTFGCCRYVHNHMLAKSIRDYQQYQLLGGTKPKVSGYDFHEQLTPLKQQPDHLWLNDVSSVALQQTLSNLGKSFTNFFKQNAKYPRFKSKHGQQSFTLVGSALKFKDGQIRIAKSTTPLKIHWSRDLPSEPSSCTVTLTPTGRYFISFVCEVGPQKTSGTKFTGVDAGITDLATLSDGTAINNPRHYVKHQKHLKRLQQSLSRKKKGSKNRNKARLQVAKLHEKITNTRLDYVHKLTTALIRENQAVGIEMLQVDNMVKNHNLAKHIMDAAWGTMREQLKYKARHSQHCVLVLAHPYYPSTQLCSGCGTRPATKLTLGMRKWTCFHCGETHQRDHNAAKNLEQLAYKLYGEYKDAGGHHSIILAPPYTPM